jgi:hypothetical protein
MSFLSFGVGYMIGILESKKDFEKMKNLLDESNDMVKVLLVRLDEIVKNIKEDEIK